MGKSTYYMDITLNLTSLLKKETLKKKSIRPPPFLSMESQD